MNKIFVNKSVWISLGSAQYMSLLTWLIMTLCNIHLKQYGKKDRRLRNLSLYISGPQSPIRTLRLLYVCAGAEIGAGRCLNGAKQSRHDTGFRGMWRYLGVEKHSRGSWSLAAPIAAIRCTEVRYDLQLELTSSFWLVLWIKTHKWVLIANRLQSSAEWRSWRGSKILQKTSLLQVILHVSEFQQHHDWCGAVRAPVLGPLPLRGNGTF